MLQGMALRARLGARSTGTRTGQDVALVGGNFGL